MNEPPSIGEMLNKLAKLPHPMSHDDMKAWLIIQYETIDPWMIDMACMFLSPKPMQIAAKLTEKIEICKTKS